MFLREMSEEPLAAPATAAGATQPTAAPADSERRDSPPPSTRGLGDVVVGEKRLSGGGEGSSRATPKHGADVTSTTVMTDLSTPSPAADVGVSPAAPTVGPADGAISAATPAALTHDQPEQERSELTLRSLDTEDTDDEDFDPTRKPSSSSDDDEDDDEDDDDDDDDDEPQRRGRGGEYVPSEGESGDSADDGDGDDDDDGEARAGASEATERQTFPGVMEEVGVTSSYPLEAAVFP